MCSPGGFLARGYLQATIKECRKALTSHITGLRTARVHEARTITGIGLVYHPTPKVPWVRCQPGSFCLVWLRLAPASWRRRRRRPVSLSAPCALCGCKRLLLPRRSRKSLLFRRRCEVSSLHSARTSRGTALLRLHEAAPPGTPTDPVLFTGFASPASALPPPTPSKSPP